MAIGIAEGSLYKRFFFAGQSSTTDDTGAAYQALRLTSDALTPTQETTQSGEVDPNRAPAADLITDAGSEGDLGIEFSAGTYDEAIRAVMMQNGTAGAWPIGGDTLDQLSDITDVSITAAGELSQDDGTADTLADLLPLGTILLLPATWYSVSTVPAYSVVSRRIDDETVGITPMQTEATDGYNALSAQASTGVTVREGVNVGTDKIPCWIEREFHTGGGLISTEFYQEVLISTFGLSFAPGSISTGSFGHNGLNPTGLGSQQRAGSDGTPTTTPVINGLTDVKSVIFAKSDDTFGAANYANLASPLPSSMVSEVSFNIDNNIRRDSAVGAFGAVNIGIGNPSLSGSLNLFIANSAVLTDLYDVMKDGVPMTFAMNVADGLGNNYWFAAASARLTGLETPNQGGGQAMFSNLSWSARSFCISRLLV